MQSFKLKLLPPSRNRHADVIFSINTICELFAHFLVFFMYNEKNIKEFWIQNVVLLFL